MHLLTPPCWLASRAPGGWAAPALCCAEAATWPCLAAGVWPCCCGAAGRGCEALLDAVCALTECEWVGILALPFACVQSVCVAVVIQKVMAVFATVFGIIHNAANAELLRSAESRLDMHDASDNIQS